LTAFGLNKHKITGRIARDSIAEIKSRGGSGRFILPDWKKIFALGGAAVMIVAAAIFHQPLRQGILSIYQPTPDRPIGASILPEPLLEAIQGAEPQAGKDDDLVASQESNQMATDDSDPTTAGQADMEPVAQSNAQATGSTEPDAYKNYDTEITEEKILTASASQQELENYEPDSEPSGTIKLAEYLAIMDIKASRYSALQDVMNLWQTPIEVQPYLTSLDDDQAFFRLTVKPKGVFVHRIETSLEMLRRVNLPAILELFPEGSDESGYLTLSRIEDDRFIFGNPDADPLVVSDANQVNLHWSGIAYLPWKNFLSIWGIIPRQSNKDSVITLKLLLHELGSVTSR
jgi:hypothetical protein